MKEILEDTLKNVLNDAHSQIKEFYNNLALTKEEICKGFIAKYGYEPDEIMLIEQQTDNGGRKFWIEKRDKEIPRCDWEFDGIFCSDKYEWNVNFRCKNCREHLNVPLSRLPSSICQK